ncbi:hypothetical protein Y032_0178g655 [Ancylostoma ceylanicum]|uniref:G-protein coupled receptors family 1 profile domain-containing protein n=2 Tax=Ancylostoma ceylanicum TaxID=53326 RepID=A0A016SU11_9BILA|nr:hypothetical protein Y032_0178g655 [Ancylostoma ceylanicum]
MFFDIEPERQADSTEMDLTIRTCKSATFGSTSDETLSRSPVQPPRDPFFWALFSTILLLMVLSFTSNLFLTIVLARSSFKNICRSFYKIMLLFVATIVVNSASDIVCMVYFEGMRYTSTVLRDITLLVSLVAYYYTTALIFLLGLNRFGVFCSPRVNNFIMKSKTLHIVLGVLFVLSILASVVVHRLTGFATSFQQDGRMNTARNTVFITISNYIFYTFPLISTGFYIICFISLRSKRSLASTGKTISLLDKAEKSTLKQGIVILSFYLLPLVAHFIHCLTPCADDYDVIISRVEMACSIAAQLTIPLTALAYLKEIRDAFWHLVKCHSL